MNVHAYARCTDAIERGAFDRAARAMFPGDHVVTRFDHLAGQLGLTSTLRSAKIGVDCVVVFRTASDAGRDLREAVRNLHDLALTPGVREVRIMNADLVLSWGDYNAAWRLIEELNNAHVYYSTTNRRLGVETARQQGARIGRRPILTLADVQKTVAEMMNAKDGRLPTARELSKKVEVSVGKAHALLKEFELSREIVDEKMNE